MRILICQECNLAAINQTWWGAMYNTHMVLIVIQQTHEREGDWAYRAHPRLITPAQNRRPVKESCRWHASGNRRTRFSEKNSFHLWRWVGRRRESSAQVGGWMFHGVTRRPEEPKVRAADQEDVIIPDTFCRFWKWAKYGNKWESLQIVNILSRLASSFKYLVII